MVWAVPSLSELLLARALPCVNPVGGGSGVPLVPVLAVAGLSPPRARRGTSSISSTPPPLAQRTIPPCARSLSTRALSFRRASSRRPRRSPRCKKPKSRSGGRSSRLRASKRSKLSEGDIMILPSARISRIRHPARQGQGESACAQSGVHRRCGRRHRVPGARRRAPHLRRDALRRWRLSHHGLRRFVGNPSGME